jgi:hypothetical protein
MKPQRRYKLTIDGSTATGVADEAGKLLDGDENGQPGGNNTALQRGFGCAEQVFQRAYDAGPYRRVVRYGEDSIDPPLTFRSSRLRSPDPDAGRRLLMKS